MAPFCIVTKAQESIAEHLVQRWTTPYLRPPIKPAGQQVDVSEQHNNGFVDIKDHHYRIKIPAECPQLPNLREIPVVTRPINWCFPNLTPVEEEEYSYLSHGVHLPSKEDKAKCDSQFHVPDFYRQHLWKEYYYSGDLRTLSNPLVYLEEEKENSQPSQQISSLVELSDDDYDPRSFDDDPFAHERDLEDAENAELLRDRDRKW
jgi:hypothetical protein